MSTKGLNNYYVNSRILREGELMTHNLTVTIEAPLWQAMKCHPEIRWSAVMKDAAKEKLQALAVLERLVKKTRLSEEEITEFAVKLGKKISAR